MSADSEKPNIIGVIRRNIALWQNLWVGVGRFERRSSSARVSLSLCGRFNQFRSPYSWITMRRALRKRRVFEFVPSYLKRLKIASFPPPPHPPPPPLTIASFWLLDGVEYNNKNNNKSLSWKFELNRTRNRFFKIKQSFGKNNWIHLLMEIVQAIKRLNLISRERLNFRRRPILCTTLYRNPTQWNNFGGAFDKLFLWILTCNFHRRCLCTLSIIIMVQKSKKRPKTQIKGSCLKGAWRDYCFRAPFSWFLHETGLESLKIISASCFSFKKINVKGKPWKRSKEHRQYFGVLGRWCTAAIDCTTFQGCQRCRKTAVFAVFSRLWGIIWRVKAFRDQRITRL